MTLSEKEAEEILNIVKDFVFFTNICKTCSGYGVVNAAPMGVFAVAGGDTCPECKGLTLYNRAKNFLESKGIKKELE